MLESENNRKPRPERRGLRSQDESLPNLVGWSYFPFFGPFLSSFLPFFFIRISFSDLGDDGRLRRATHCALIYGWSAQESRKFVVKLEKTGYLGAPPVK
jgi:hypothetical protein